MKKLIIILLLGLLLPVLTKAQSYTFTKTMWSVYVSSLGVKSEWSEWEDSPTHFRLRILERVNIKLVFLAPFPIVIVVSVKFM